MGQIDDIIEELEIFDFMVEWTATYNYIVQILQKHLEPQQTNKKADERIEEENIMYDYGFQAGRVYEKQHPSEPQQEDKIEPFKFHWDMPATILTDKINEIIDFINNK